MQPGQFLTAYLDRLPHLKSIIGPVDYKAAIEHANMARREGVLFALPDYGQLKDRTINAVFPGSIFKPPYPVCVIEFAGDHLPEVPLASRSSKRVIVVQDRGTHAELVPLAYRDTDGAWHPPIFKFDLFYGSEMGAAITGKSLMLPTGFGKVLPVAFSRMVEEAFGGSLEQCARAMADDFIDELWAYLDFCRVLNEDEVTFDDIVPDKVKNRMRRARGKAPLFTYKVLTIGGPKKRKGHQGGTHASPRSHLRRGYYRTSKHGKRHWVQPCMVKGETPGFVHKDYKVEGANDGTNPRG